MSVTSDPFDFTGATAVILGGATGLGRVMADALLARGAHVCIASRSSHALTEAANEMNRTSGGRCTIAECDVTIEGSVVALRDELARIWPQGLNIAVNSAGTNVRNPVTGIPLQEWEHVQRVNSTGAFLFAREMFPLLQRAAWGRLINVASLFSSRSYPNRASYAASKGAMLQLTRTLAIEWASTRITVNAIAPGPFLTEINKTVLDNPANYATFCSRIPLGRFGEPDEIATACLFLASPGSSYITGAAIAVDGGWSAG